MVKVSKANSFIDGRASKHSLKLKLKKPYDNFNADIAMSQKEITKACTFISWRWFLNISQYTLVNTQFINKSFEYKFNEEKFSLMAKMSCV